MNRVMGGGLMRARGRAFLRVAAVLLALASIAGPVGAQPDAHRGTGTASATVPSRIQPDFDGVRALIRSLMAEQDLPSIAVAVAKDGRIVWEEGFGWADREGRVPATPHTLYSLASISKPITATGLMRLVEDGKVDLDAPANQYLGAGRISGRAGAAEAATVRRILNHTAGLPLHYQFFYEDGGYDVPTMDETIARYAVVMIPPGESVQYSNLGFGIIDYITARVSGMSYADYMRTHVFVPLDMTRTSVGLTPELRPHAAVRYDARQRPIPFYRFDHDGASAVWSSAHDLVRFGMFHLKNRLPEQKRILTDATIDAMKVVTSSPDGRAGYGISWNVNPDDLGFTRVSHTGGMPGVATVLNLYPSEDLAIVVLANKGSAPVGRIAAEVAAAVLPRYATALRERGAQPANQPTEPFRPPPELAGEWSGTLHTYDRDVPIRLTFQPDGDVHVRLDRQLATLLNDATWRNGALTGRFAGTLPTPDASRHRHSVLLNLRLADDVLRGQASAQTTEEPVYYALTSYVELRKGAPASSDTR